MFDMSYRDAYCAAYRRNARLTADEYSRGKYVIQRAADDTGRIAGRDDACRVVWRQIR